MFNIIAYIHAKIIYMECLCNIVRRKKAERKHRINMKKSPYLYDQRLYDPLQRVYSYLSVHDLATLSQVSRRLYRDILNYYESTSLRLSLKMEVNKVLNRQPLLIRDEVVRNTFEECQYSYRWLYLTWKRYKEIRRVLIRDIDFPKKGNEDFFPIYFDNNLGREIVEVNNVRALHLGYTFEDVQSGNYQVSLRMEINAISWGRHEAPARIRIHWDDSEDICEIKTEIKWDRWSFLRNHLRKSKSVNSNGAFLTNFDPNTGWFDYCIQNVEIKETSDVNFEFNDVENDMWKSGMRWDYLELSPTIM